MRKIKQPFIIDVEASGFGSSSYPIEVGVALENGQKFCTLIQPLPEWDHWDKQAEKVHQISRDTLKNYGSPIDEVTEKLNQLLAGKTLYSDGWVVDKPWLLKLFYAAKKPMNFYISPLEMILSEQQMEKWHATKDHLIEESQLTRHRASNDAWIIQKTYEKTLDMGADKT